MDDEVDEAVKLFSKEAQQFVGQEAVKAAIAVYPL
jgi:hypothetical protein